MARARHCGERAGTTSGKTLADSVFHHGAARQTPIVLSDMFCRKPWRLGDGPKVPSCRGGWVSGESRALTCWSLPIGPRAGKARVRTRKSKHQGGRPPHSFRRLRNTCCRSARSAGVDSNSPCVRSDLCSLTGSEEQQSGYRAPRLANGAMPCVTGAHCPRAGVPA